MRKLLPLLLMVTAFLMSALEMNAQTSVGLASYYSDSFQGRRTASGENYDKNKLTAAHKEYPFGTYLKVTRIDNKKSIVVKVNDRGPYIKGRIVDLSGKAAEALGIVSDGQAEVKIEVVSKPEPEEAVAASNANIEAPDAAKPTEMDQPTTTPAPAKPAAVEKPAPVQPAKPTAAEQPKPEPPKTTTPVAPKPTEAFEAGTMVVKGKDYKDYDLYKVQLLRPERTGFGVQVASMANYQNVLKQIAELQEKWFNNILMSVEPGTDDKPIYKIILGPFPDRKTAESYLKDLKKKKGLSGFIVDLKAIDYPK